MSAMHQSLEPETCTTCGQAALRGDRVRSAIWAGTDLLVVEDVPAVTCGACGAMFYDDATSAVLDQLRRKGMAGLAVKRELSVPVVGFPGAGA
jgi:YgiT-type zinc finger domain-containing protein